jgi:hypothetical protein
MNPAMVKRMNEDMNRVMAMPDVQEKFEQYGAEDGGGGSAAVAPGVGRGFNAFLLNLLGTYLRKLEGEEDGW